MSYKLVRKSDGLVKESRDVIWIEFHINGTFKESFDGPVVGRSLLMSPFNAFFTWQTTPITKVIRKTKYTVTFKTENSEYKLTLKKE
jgi:hypothetical protein